MAIRTFYLKKKKRQILPYENCGYSNGPSLLKDQAAWEEVPIGTPLERATIPLKMGTAEKVAEPSVILPSSCTPDLPQRSSSRKC